MSTARISSKTINFIRNQFTKRPIIANAVIYGVLFTGAEFSQQVLTRKLLVDQPKNLDTTSLTHYAIFGTVIQGPVITIWFKWLDAKFVGKSIKMVTKKLLIDQTIGATAELIVFYLAMSLMERKPDLLEECKSKFIDSYKSSCIFWIPAQLVNFMFVPPSLRVLYFGVASFAWVNVLCYIKRQDYK